MDRPYEYAIQPPIILEAVYITKIYYEKNYPATISSVFTMLLSNDVQIIVLVSGDRLLKNI